MRFILRAAGAPERLAILPGSFNPPTLAHIGLIEAAREHADEILCVIPQVFPHKIFHGATLEQRLEMLKEAMPGANCSIAVSERGLFIDIARECRDCYGLGPELQFVCGTDAAERILTWDYGRAGAIESMLGEFSLLVAERQVRLEAPPAFTGRICRLDLAQGLDEISATDVRDRVRRNEPWEHLVPQSIAAQVRKIYGR